jgi:endo-1,3(4)-beta-glucanase
MAKLAYILLALTRLTFSVHGLPAVEAKLHTDAIEARAITLPSDVPVTTSYSTAIESLQSASTTGLPSLSGVCQITHLRRV